MTSARTAGSCPMDDARTTRNRKKDTRKPGWTWVRVRDGTVMGQGRGRTCSPATSWQPTYVQTAMESWEGWNVLQDLCFENLVAEGTWKEVDTKMRQALFLKGEKEATNES